VVTYRIYQVDREGRVFGAPHIIQCDDDDAALVEGRNYIDRRAVEIWRDHKRVGLIPADD
jgi:hypothetical protein